MSNTTQEAFQIFLLLSALLCTLVFGFLLVFDIVIMPGIGKLDDGGFLRAFQLIDGMIQDNQPVFVFIWVTSVLALITTMGLGASEYKDGARLIWMVVATAAYLIGQVTTFTINVPMNNRLQTLNIATLDYSTLKVERERFEVPWNSWNRFRTVLFGFTSGYLLVALLLEESAM